VYDRPEQTPYLDIGALFKLLFRPKEAFEDLYDHTSATQGFILAFVFIALSAVLGIVFNLLILGTADLPDDVVVAGFTEGNAVISIIGIFTGIFFFWLTAWMFHAFVKTKARNPSVDKTIGMMGYAKFPAFIIMTIIGIIAPALALGVDPDQADEGLAAVCGLLAAIVGLGIVGIIWAWWVHAHAQSVANDMSTSSAFGWLFLTWILVGLISAAVGFVIALVVIGATFGV
jgi:hypothetical protein